MKIGNYDGFNIVSEVSICLKIKLGSFLLTNARHVPELRMNFMSRGVLDEEGFA